MVGGGTPAEEQRHWVALIPKGWLHSNEDIAELPAVDQQVLALRIQLACRSCTPMLTNAHGTYAGRTDPYMMMECSMLQETYRSGRQDRS